MDVDNARVRTIIDDAIRRAAANGDNCCGKTFSAWQNLKAWRDRPPRPGATPNSLDLDVAAAENYMYARATVCSGFISRRQMNVLAFAYYATKVLGVQMPTSGNPQAPARIAVARWGVIGSEEGEADRRRCNPGASPPLWRPVNEIMPLSGRYARTMGRPGTSYAPPPRRP